MPKALQERLSKDRDKQYYIDEHIVITENDENNGPGLNTILKKDGVIELIRENLFLPLDPIDEIIGHILGVPFEVGLWILDKPYKIPVLEPIGHILLFSLK